MYKRYMHMVVLDEVNIADNDIGLAVCLFYVVVPLLRFTLKYIPYNLCGKDSEKG